LGFSKYPNEIDDSTTLPPSVDLVTPVKAEVVNRLRDAALAIEGELGINPSGTFGSVTSKLLNIDSRISDLTISSPTINSLVRVEDIAGGA